MNLASLSGVFETKSLSFSAKNFGSVSSECGPHHATFTWQPIASNVAASKRLTRSNRGRLHSFLARKLSVGERSYKLQILLPRASKDASLGDSEQTGGPDEAPTEVVEHAGIDTTAESTERPSKIAEICGALTSLFPVWVVVAASLALVRPAMFTWFKGQLLVSGVALTMLGMGTTLSMKDFEGAAAMRKEFLAGVFLQYTVMPCLGALVATSLGLPHHYAVGIVLVSCCPGGTASNIVTYLARGNVALSVLLTATSTMLAVFMTPLLTAKLAGQLVPVNAQALFLSTVQVVLLPVLGGAMLAQYFPRQVAVISPFAPLVAVVTVALICASCIGQSAAAILSSGTQLLTAVAILHSGGFFLGYLLSSVLGFDRKTSRTISIEVGMQNSALGVVLATQNFANPLTAAPCAISSVCHSVLGSLLASVWYFQEARRARSKTA